MKQENKLKIALSLSGALFGALLIYILWLVKPDIFTNLAIPEGAKFENLKDLRAALSKRDSRDTLADGSVSFRSIIAPHPSDNIIYELIPNQNTRFMRVPLTTNSFGMRNPETTQEKPANTYRIALLGDSYAFGWGVEQENTFARQMQENANKLLPQDKKKIEVLNFGVPGYATFQEVETFFAKALNFNPDAVMVYIISNDFALPFFIKDLKSGSSLVPAQEFHRSKISPENTDALKRRAKMFNSLDSNAALARLIKYASKNNLETFIVFHPGKKVAETAKRFKVLNNPKLADAFKRIEISDEFFKAIDSNEVPKESLRLKGDEHPGPGAHKIIGRLLGERLAEHLIKK